MGSKVIQKPERPVRGAFMGACMLFARSEIIGEIPYDPYLYFFGEEITLSARFWTHGWDIFHPHVTTMYHYWERKGRRTHFDDHDWQTLNQRSFARVRHMLGTEPSTDPDVTFEIERYGLGTARPLAAYQAFAGVDFTRRVITQEAYEGKFPVGEAALNTLAPARAPAFPKWQPRKVLETPELIVYDDFLPQELCDRMYDYTTQIDYQYINTQGKVKRVWDISNGFPLRNDRTIFYYADPADKPDAPYAYPSNSPFDRFIDRVNGIMPQVDRLVSPPASAANPEGWNHYSVTSWIYPPGTGLSLHDDGAGVYTGAYVYFMSPVWRPHWGGMLVVLDPEANAAIREHKKQTDTLAFYKKKWLHTSEHDELAMSLGLGRCIMPKRNRLVFIAPDAYHMVTKVQPECGDNMRMSLAGFFHRGKQKREGAKGKDQKPPAEYE
jgi:hypothetical protein